jgi:NAD(P)-dependent dehydrogenase (short-subunit alcohol dehydrogenase family)
MNGRVALITGGNSGIGRATAMAFARAGAKVAIAARRSAEGQETVRMINEAGGDAFFVQTDVSQSSQVQDMVRKTVEKYGRLDAAFNNAAIAKRAALVEMTETEFDSVISVNLKGVWLCMKYEIPRMLANGGGTIVNTSSGYGLFGSPRGNCSYIASKHAVIGLTKAAALEYAKQGIRVNAVLPGWTHTAMLEESLRANPRLEPRILDHEPTGRMGTAAEVAQAVLWLCSDAASFVTGHSMLVDGGLTAWIGI